MDTVFRECTAVIGLLRDPCRINLYMITTKNVLEMMKEIKRNLFNKPIMNVEYYSFSFCFIFNLLYIVKEV